MGKSKVMRCSGYVNAGRINERLDGEPVKEVCCFRLATTSLAKQGINLRK